jgi:hypothetical protein
MLRVDLLLADSHRAHARKQPRARLQRAALCHLPRTASGIWAAVSKPSSASAAAPVASGFFVFAYMALWPLDGLGTHCAQPVHNHCSPDRTQNTDWPKQTGSLFR